MMQEKELVLIPRREYEALTRKSSPLPLYEEVGLSFLQKRKIVSAQKRLAAGKTMTLHELRKKLGL